MIFKRKQRKILTSDEHKALFLEISSTQIPDSGQSETVQGELLRSQIRLFKEATRNGNMNWGNGYSYFADYIEETLTSDKVLERSEKKQLLKDLARLRNFQDPYLENDLYKRIQKLILMWCAQQDGPISKPHNENINI